METVSFLAIPFLVLGLDAVVAYPQWAPSNVAIAHVEGDVYIDGQRVPQLATDLIVKENSIVRTEKGRAEVRFDRGDIMFLGKNSSVRVNHESNTGSGGLEILTGSAVVVTGALGPAVRCQENVQLSD